MACFADLLCFISTLKINDMDVDVENTTDNGTGSMMAYNYPNHTMLLTGLKSGTTYNYCVIAMNATNLEEVGEQMCGNFTTAAPSCTEGIYISYKYSLSHMYTVDHTHKHTHKHTKYTHTRAHTHTHTHTHVHIHTKQYIYLRKATVHRSPSSKSVYKLHPPCQSSHYYVCELK